MADSPRMRLRLASRSRGVRRAAVLAGALAAAALVAGPPVRADEPIVVTSCPGGERIAVTFKVDCSHVRDPAARAQCRPFIENQACKVFPAYRRITGINLEKPCPEIVYTIYDKDQWPHPPGGEGGQAGRCSAELLSQFSVLIESSIGPYDVHELLHLYQSQIGSVPYSHILFGASQLEARREIGDHNGYEAGFARLKKEALDPNLNRSLRAWRPICAARWRR